jgi:hypothetical protein
MRSVRSLLDAKIERLAALEEVVSDGATPDMKKLLVEGSTMVRAAGLLLAAG